MTEKYNLYLKTHRITGLKYLGYTKRDPMEYKGSGVQWKQHLDEHGDDVETVVLLTTENIDDIKNTGLYLSNLWSIVDTDWFANLIPETGGSGLAWIKGKKRPPRTEAHRRAISEALKKSDKHPTRGKKHSAEHRRKISEATKGRTSPMKGRTMSDETKKKMSEAAMGRQNSLGSKRERVKCPKCGEVGPVNVWARWHGENCGKVWKHSDETTAAISKAKKGVPWSDAKVDAYNEKHGTIHHHDTAYRSVREAEAGSGYSRHTIAVYLKSEDHPEWRRVKP